MFKPWVDIPTADVKVCEDRFAGEYRIMFKDASVVDKVIEQLENLRELLLEMEAEK